MRDFATTGQVMIRGVLVPREDPTETNDTERRARLRAYGMLLYEHLFPLERVRLMGHADLIAARRDLEEQQAAMQVAAE